MTPKKTSHGLVGRCCISTKDLYDNITCNLSGVKLLFILGIGTPTKIDIESEHVFFQKESRPWRVRFQVPAVSFGGVYTLGYDQIDFLFATFQVNISGIQKWSYPLCSIQNLQTSQEIWKQYFCQGVETNM